MASDDHPKSIGTISQIRPKCKNDKLLSVNKNQ